MLKAGDKVRVMQLEAGKFYKTRGGCKVGVMSISDINIAELSDGRHVFAENGKLFIDERETDGDIVALWDEGPVRTVTHREIVPGVYGRVSVGENGYVGLTSCDFQHGTYMTAEELREAAHLFNQLAEVLESGE